MKDKKEKVVKRLAPTDRFPGGPDIDPGDGPPSMILPPKEEEERDASHEVHLTGIGFVQPKNPPKPREVNAPPKISQDTPAQRLAAEQKEPPKFPLYH